MRNKYRLFIYAACVIIYAICGAFATNRATDVMSERDLSLLSEKAMDMAVLMARSYRVTDGEVDELKRLAFRELLAHPANARLARLFEGGFSHHDIRYAYVMTLSSRNFTHRIYRKPAYLLHFSCFCREVTLYSRG